jgi:hypothetical protein
MHNLLSKIEKPKAFEEKTQSSGFFISRKSKILSRWKDVSRREKPNNSQKSSN